MKTILLADDEPMLRSLIRRTLEDSQIRIEEADNGLSALESILRSAPDLVLLDWKMPGLTGIDVLAAIRGDARLRALPVIMLTGCDDEEARATGERVGANAFLVKPFSPLELLETVRLALSSSDDPCRIGEALRERLSLSSRDREKAEGQDALYARDLKTVVEAERKKSGDLAVANARLEALSKLKSDFLEFVAHHLRTPLTALAAIDLVDMHGDPHEQDEVISIVRSGFSQMHALIERALAYFGWVGRSPIQSSESIELVQVVRSFAALETPNRSAFSGEVEIDCDEASFVMHTENRSIVEALTLVLDNAFKFSDHGKKVRVALRVASGWASVSISDQGRGIAPDFAAQLFDPFTIGDAKCLASGKGLNLAMARAIIDAHGGRIRLSSNESGIGATATVDLPGTGASARVFTTPSSGDAPRREELELAR